MQQINDHLPTKPLAKPTKDEEQDIAKRTRFNRMLEIAIDGLLLNLSSGDLYQITTNWQKYKALCGEPGSLRLRQRQFLWELGLLLRKTGDKEMIINICDGLCQTGIPRSERAELLDGLRTLRQQLANGNKLSSEDTKK